MALVDLFAWIVLLVLATSAVAIFSIAGYLQGHIANTRGHPHAQAVTVAGWETLIWAFVDAPAR